VEALTRHEIALQHNVMPWTHAVAAKAAVQARVPAVWFQHNRPHIRKIIDWYASLSPAALILANSKFTARLQQRMNPRRIQIEVLYPPAEPAARRSTDHSIIRSTLGAGPADILAVLPGRLQRWKGHDVALRALAGAVKSVPSLRLAIVGDTLFGQEPEYRGELVRLTRDLGIGDHVCFAGFHKAMDDVYLAADLVIHTSREAEPFGLVVAEALANSRPVIATGAGAIPEQIVHEQTGLLVPPDDVAALTRAVIRIGTDSNLRERLGLAAGQRGIVRAADAARRLERLYSTVLES
jgi:glycosyltransferase involved in cell wall biosynthesis